MYLYNYLLPSLYCFILRHYFHCFFIVTCTSINLYSAALCFSSANSHETTSGAWARTRGTEYGPVLQPSKKLASSQHPLDEHKWVCRSVSCPVHQLPASVTHRLFMSTLPPFFYDWPSLPFQLSAYWGCGAIKRGAYCAFEEQTNQFHFTLTWKTFSPSTAVSMLWTLFPTYIKLSPSRLRFDAHYSEWESDDRPGREAVLREPREEWQQRGLHLPRPVQRGQDYSTCHCCLPLCQAEWAHTQRTMHTKC